MDSPAPAFVREERYIVIKRKHLTAFAEGAIRNQLAALDVPTTECVVVEHDWPEFETVWKMIEARVTGRAEFPIESWPRALTPELRSILGFMCLTLAPMAHAYQAAGRFVDADGCALEKRAEDEQAFMLHRFLTHWWDEGADWQAAMGLELEQVVEAAKRAQADKAAANG